MAKAYEPGQQVQWSWGQGTGEGTVREVFRERVTRQIKGATVTRNADEDNPAYVIEQHDGDEVLKSHSELST
jgi:hypothetical protein